MIRVELAPEPASFDMKVRKKGFKWLDKNGLDLDQPVPEKTKLKSCWRDCLEELWSSYNGVCAYLGVYFEFETGGATVEHFVAKSTSKARLAYEWSNYRLASSRVNSRKNKFDDVLDPCEIEDGWFWLEIVSGRIYPAKDLAEGIEAQVEQTIQRLKLDSKGAREMRVGHVSWWLQGEVTALFLQRQSPFVWKELQRQNLL